MENWKLKKDGFFYRPPLYQYPVILLSIVIVELGKIIKGKKD